MMKMMLNNLVDYIFACTFDNVTKKDSIREIFHEFDNNKKGYLSLEELI